jgi:hypothetical protein
MLYLRDGSLASSELAWQEREVIYSGTLAAWLRTAPGHAGSRTKWRRGTASRSPGEEGLKRKR